MVGEGLSLAIIGLVIVFIVLAFLSTVIAPVSYTHLTLPTN